MIRVLVVFVFVFVEYLFCCAQNLQNVKLNDDIFEIAWIVGPKLSI